MGINLLFSADDEVIFPACRVCSQHLLCIKLKHGVPSGMRVNAKQRDALIVLFKEDKRS